ncbi:hypothetical protein FF011L_50590 [Roseimaritima multifibrata]|uniref:EF-hand domain-containing protein n=1 Tax=Roseimaritima multifibrata TaxID=1930274 RepID=A0A517MN03_9BACT|nr:dockerin type I domain-containing protein [Roseimaritima multifibrata]QDS96251.1 hypothetical protein FF011L_50590 [Roseimaritima multifibrata]
MNWFRRIGQAGRQRKVRGRIEVLEARNLLATVGETFVLTEVVDTAGLAGATSAIVDWGDGTSSVANVSGDAAPGPLRIRFDYSLDADGFFAGAERKAILQAAADSIVQRFADRLDSIQPSGGNTWVPAIIHPRTGSSHSLATSFGVQANELVIFVGARDLPQNQVGQGATGYFSTASGSSSWLDKIRSRGQEGALGTSLNDIGPWGGSLAFDTKDQSGENRDWFFGEDISEIGSGQNDFFSVAVHELAHVLGFGTFYVGATSSAWEVLAGSGSFGGESASTLYGTDVPLSGVSHWQDGLEVDGRETNMDPSLTKGTRVLFSPLDFAAMKDIGWTVSDLTATVQASHTYQDSGAYDVQVLVRGNRVGQLSETLAVDVAAVQLPYFQNPVNRFDVDGNGRVEPQDALEIINQLNRRNGRSELVPGEEPTDLAFIDVDGDYLLIPLDALEVINRLNQLSRRVVGESLPTEDTLASSLSDQAIVDFSWEWERQRRAL